MKAITSIILVTAITFTAKSQYSKEDEYHCHYGINVSSINTGSGHGHGVSINTNIQKDNKSLEVGAIFQNSKNGISGADLKYKIFVGHFNDFQYGKKIFSPYVQYNLIYRKLTVNAPVVINRDKSTIEIPVSEPGTIATMEHYASLGFQLKIYNKFYLDNTLGLGIYIGSVDKVNKQDSFGLHMDNYGFTGSIKIGLGYRFN